MNRHEQPFVSVVTPVYNGEEFLAECIESILRQTYTNWEYIVVNNRSTDRSLEIASDYAKKDDRIRVHSNSEFVGVIENHNIAFRLVSAESKYCKVVSADDWIFPDCLLRMVECAEANPTVGLVGSYSQAGKTVLYQGLEYEQKVVRGAEICRATLLGGPYVFGSPTSLLYRADLLRQSKAFYPNSNPHSDTTACYQSLEHSDFGFVHQVLSFTRIHSASQTSKSLKFGTINLAVWGDVARFGPKYLSPSELRQRLTSCSDQYYRALVPTVFAQPRNKEFWQRQRTELQERGLKFSRAQLLKAFFWKGLRYLLKPSAAFRRFLSLKRNAEKIEARYYGQNSRE